MYLQEVLRIFFHILYHNQWISNIAFFFFLLDIHKMSVRFEKKKKKKKKGIFFILKFSSDLLFHLCLS